MELAEFIKLAHIFETVDAKEARKHIAHLQIEITDLKKVIEDTLWMARRYANNRRTYAPGMYNDAVRQLLALGIEVKGDPAENGQIWAADGDTGLPHEAQEATNG